MKRADGNPTKDLYRQLRTLSCHELWQNEVPRFNHATAAQRLENVALVRAVGVVFSEDGNPEQREAARLWLRDLLRDSQEKIRRYALNALPKLGAGIEEETVVLDLLKTGATDREKKFVARTLDKIGGVETLRALAHEFGAPLLQTAQKVNAAVARDEAPSVIRLDRVFSNFAGLRIQLRTRRGLEEFVREELESHPVAHWKFKVTEVRAGMISVVATAPFTLGDLFALRCFATVSFVLGVAKGADENRMTESLALAITSPMARGLFDAFTDGAFRYRLEFAGKGHQRGAVRGVTNRAYQLCPEILNDARQAPWSISIHPIPGGNSVELSPRLSPDPRFAYRQGDVPAASHPPLAAAMARLAGRVAGEIVWDPFCGSGLELIERSLLGGVRKIYGTDRSAGAIETARKNFEAADISSVEAEFACCDFRDLARLGPESATLIITNPPMGKRVPIPNLRGLIEDLFSVAARTLKPGGRLIFANPLGIGSANRLLKLEFQRVIDLGGLECRLEMYRQVTDR